MWVSIFYFTLLKTSHKLFNKHSNDGLRNTKNKDRLYSKQRKQLFINLQICRVSL